MLIQTSIILGSLILGGVEAAAIETSCRAYPGTSTWPSTSQWAALDTAVSGRLDAVVPPGAVCHNSFNGVSTFNQAKCTQLLADYKVNQGILYVLAIFPSVLFYFA